MASVREIAEFVGVSKSTVSLVLNNRPGVSDKMRQVVMHAVNTLEASHAEETLTDKKRQTYSIMCLHPPVVRSSYVFSQVLQGIQNAAERYKAQLRLVVNDPQASAQHVSHLYLTDECLRPDGVLVFGAEQNEPLLEKVVKQNIPCVVLGREAKKYQVSGIERDETYYAYQLTRHLLDIGHCAIAFVGGETRYDYTNNRLHGYRLALEDAGLSSDEHIVCLGDGAVASANILDTHPEVTAIIFVNDSYLIEGLSVLHKRGLTIPDDLSVVSFDNTEIAQNYESPITSVAYHHFQEGQWAVKMLLDQIQHPFIEKSYQVFRGELIIRESTAAPCEKVS